MIELLVLTGAIALMIALLIPAVLTAHDASSRPIVAKQTVDKHA
jgi:hypothetical protein